MFQNLNMLTESTFAILRRDIEDVQLLLIAIERQKRHSDTKLLIDDVQKANLKIEAQIGRMYDSLSREPASSRLNASAKLDQLRSDAYLVKSAFSTIKSRFETQCRNHEERQELLTKRFSSNNETRINMGFDYELQTNQRLQSSGNLIDEILSQGVHVLEDLQKQKNNLFNIQNRFRYLAKTIGISETTIKVIDKRFKEDKHIFIFACIFSLIFNGIFYMWWKGYF